MCVCVCACVCVCHMSECVYVRVFSCVCVCVCVCPVSECVYVCVCVYFSVHVRVVLARVRVVLL